MASTTPPTLAAAPLRLGLRANAAQFALLVGVNGLVGALVGQERTLVPLLGERVFGLTTATAGTAFLVAFGIAKAAANLAAGVLSERFGRRPVLIAGWAVGAPVPLLLMWAPAWSWVIAANALLGVNQGLTWSTTVVMKMDLAGPHRRGLAMGLNEFAGYTALALSAAVTGALAARYGLRPEPLFLGLAVAALGLGLSFLFVRETASHARLESREAPPPASEGEIVNRRVPGLATVSRTGLVNNANDAVAWALVPLLMARDGLDVVQIGLAAALYPAVWGVGQIGTGMLSDRIGRRAPIVVGMAAQAVALASMIAADGLMSWLAAAFLLGAGTALAYPALLAAVGDLAGPGGRARAVGVYRSWRDLGYVAGAVVGGVVADLVGMEGALGAVAALTAFSALDAWSGLSGRPKAGPHRSSNDLNNLG